MDGQAPAKEGKGPLRASEGEQRGSSEKATGQAKHCPIPPILLAYSHAGIKGLFRPSVDFLDP